MINIKQLMVRVTWDFFSTFSEHREFISVAEGTRDLLALWGRGDNVCSSRSAGEWEQEPGPGLWGGLSL